jgi:hypothetical protein
MKHLSPKHVDISQNLADPVPPSFSGTSTLLDFPQFTLSCQNCNSLNISTECDKQLTKIISITSLLSNVIFLSDIRMGGTPMQSEKN